MKIGLSLSRCVKDIYEGKVEENDVLVIVARTSFNPFDDDQWEQVFTGYLHGGFSHAEWADYGDKEEHIRKLVCNLYEDGKIHQPRLFGAHAPRLDYYWLECFIDDNDDLIKPAVKKAWDNYKIIAGLS
jgi:hypothetical protein